MSTALPESLPESLPARRLERFRRVEPPLLGKLYRFVHREPADCQGEHYRAVRLVTDVPSYQPKVLVEGVSGPDAGKWYVVSLAGFATRFQLVPLIE